MTHIFFFFLFIKEMLVKVIQRVLTIHTSGFLDLKIHRYDQKMGQMMIFCSKNLLMNLKKPIISPILNNKINIFTSRQSKTQNKT